MVRWIRNNFRNQIMVVFIPIISLIVMGSVFFFYNVSASIIESQTQELMYGSLENATDYFDNLLDSTTQELLRFAYTGDVADALLVTDATDSYEYFLSSQDMRSHITDITLLNADIQTVYAYSVVSERLFFTDQPRTYTKADIEFSNWYGIMMEQYQSSNQYRMQWLFMDDDLQSGSPYMLICTSPVYREFSGAIVGFASLNIDTHTLDTILESALITPDAQYYIADQSGTILYHSDKTKLGTQIDQAAYTALHDTADTTIAEGRFIATITSSQMSDWTLFLECDYENVLAPLVTLARSAYASLLIAIIMVVVAISALSKSVVRPVRTLRTFMQSAQQRNYKERIDETRDDEFGDLFYSYNQMMDQTDQLINDNYTQKILITQLHVKNLQAQISPHFLYNALDSVHWAVRDGSTDEACEMIYCLADHFRKGLTDGREVLPVRECAEIMESYLTLQRVLHEYTIDVSVYVNPLVAQMPVLKYLFQPIIENAFKHGLSKKAGPRSVAIRFESVCDGKLRFIVKDNGVGMSSEKLQELRESLQNANSNDMQEHLALKNIQLQLRMLYDGATLEIQSAEGVGTVVSFTIAP